jgi:hypothetical protein
MFKSARLFRLRLAGRILVLAMLLAALPLAWNWSAGPQANANSGTQHGHECEHGEHRGNPHCRDDQHLPHNSCSGGTFSDFSQYGKGSNKQYYEVVIQANGVFYVADQNGHPVYSDDRNVVHVTPDRDCDLDDFDPGSGKYRSVGSDNLSTGHTYALLPTSHH